MVKATACIVLALLALGSTDARQSGLETNDVADYSTTNSFNFVFDIFLKRFSHRLIEEGRTSVKVSDFSRWFKQKLLFVKITGSVEVKDGWCGNLSTLHRTGDADMTRSDGMVVLSVHMGMQDLKIDYNSYNVSFLNSHQKGEIHVRVGYNSLFLKLNVHLKPECRVELAEFQIEDLDDIRVDITHLGIFESLTDDITEWAAEEAIKWFRNYIDDILYPELAQVVKNADLCRYMPF